MDKRIKELIDIVKKGNAEDCEGFIVTRKDSNFYHTHLLVKDDVIYQPVFIGDIRKIEIVPKGELPF